MTSVVYFTFNPFQENTYIVYDDTKECAIFDPGCHNAAEQQELVQFIEQNNLKPVHLINTHCHVDHVFGNRFIADKYNLPLTSHKGEKVVLEFAVMMAKAYGFDMQQSPDISIFLEEGDVLTFGETRLEVLFTPGHSPASISFYCAEVPFLIAGDVLFRESIGRTDLPGGNFDTLINSIKQKFYPLPDNTTVYSGHGEKTTLGYEKKKNLFLTHTEHFRSKM